MSSRKHLRELSARLLAAQEEERRRVAHEVQEKLIQSFVAVQYRVETAMNGMKDGNTKWRELLEPIGSILREGMRTARSLAERMRPETLDDLGLLVTISRLCRKVAIEHPALSIDQRLEIEEADIPDALKVVIYRILQIALSGILRKGPAGLIEISLERKGDRIRLVVRDHSGGLDPEQILWWNEEQGWGGSAGVGERVMLSGGSINVYSERKAGTTLQVEWPVGDSNLPIEIHPGPHCDPGLAAPFCSEKSKARE